MKQLNTQSGNLSTLEFGPVDKMVTDSERLELANYKLEIAIEALKIYARRIKDGKCWNWHGKVFDSYSGEEAVFDYDGDEGDEPWEMAEKAIEEINGK